METKSSGNRQFRMSADELSHWNENGFFVRQNVFSKDENDVIRQVADDIVDRKYPFPEDFINQNALVRDGKIEEQGIHAMHKIHHVNFYSQEFLDRKRDSRLTDPIVDLLGPDILSLGNLYIWKAPKIGLGFPWHQDKWYFNWQFKTDMTVATWTAIDDADIDNGCLYVVPGSHKDGIYEHKDIEGSQQREFKQAQGVRDEEGIPVEVPGGSVIWFNSQVLHKSCDNHSLRFRRANVGHYISAKAERVPSQKGKIKKSVMWIRGDAHPGKIDEVEHDVFPITKTNKK